MKKVLALFLSAIMTLSLTSCGGNYEVNLNNINASVITTLPSTTTEATTTTTTTTGTLEQNTTKTKKTTKRTTKATTKKTTTTTKPVSKREFYENYFKKNQMQFIGTTVNLDDANFNNSTFTTTKDGMKYCKLRVSDDVFIYYCDKKGNAYFYNNYKINADIAEGVKDWHKITDDESKLFGLFGFPSIDNFKIPTNQIASIGSIEEEYYFDVVEVIGTNGENWSVAVNYNTKKVHWIRYEKQGRVSIINFYEKGDERFEKPTGNATSTAQICEYAYKQIFVKALNRGGFGFTGFSYK